MVRPRALASFGRLLLGSRSWRSQNTGVCATSGGLSLEPNVLLYHVWWQLRYLGDILGARLNDSLQKARREAVHSLSHETDSELSARRFEFRRVRSRRRNRSVIRCLSLHNHHQQCPRKPTDPAARSARTREPLLEALPSSAPIYRSPRRTHRPRKSLIKRRSPPTSITRCVLVSARHELVQTVA